VKKHRPAPLPPIIRSPGGGFVATLGGQPSRFGVATINFGAFPGSTDASVAVTGQTDILAGSSVFASLRATATADHSVDEHVVEEMDVLAGSIIPGTGFTIYARTRNTAISGQWSVAWSWA
jgi:hypothetical protein